MQRVNADTPNQAPGPALASDVVQSASGLRYAITHAPSFAMLQVDLEPGQLLVAEAGSMVARHRSVSMDVKMNAGQNPGLFARIKAFLIAVLRKLVGGETFFVNHFSAAAPGSVWIAPSLSGQVVHRRMAGETLTLSTGAYLASAGPLELGLKFGGLRSLLAKEGAFFLQVSGEGDLFFNSYGGVESVDIDGSYIVDTGHLVGFEGDLTYDITSAGGGMLGLFASGEGLVCAFRGKGRVYIQTRNLGALTDWLLPFMPS